MHKISEGVIFNEKALVRRGADSSTRRRGIGFHIMSRAEISVKLRVRRRLTRWPPLHSHLVLVPGVQLVPNSAQARACVEKMVKPRKNNEQSFMIVVTVVCSPVNM